MIFLRDKDKFDALVNTFSFTFSSDGSRQRAQEYKNAFCSGGSYERAAQEPRNKRLDPGLTGPGYSALDPSPSPWRQESYIRNSNQSPHGAQVEYELSAF